MYQYVSAVLRKRGKNQVWQNADIAMMTLDQVFKTYQDGYITLTNPTTVYVDLNTLKRTAVPYAGSLPFINWIQSTGMPTLPTIPQPTFTTHHALYSEATQAQYTINRILPFDYTPGSNEPLEICHDESDNPPPDYHLMTNLEITKSGVDYNEFHQFVLVSINGFYHRSTITEKGMQVIDGSKSIDITGQTAVGLVSFREIGAVHQIAITPAMMGKQYADHPYREEMYINVGEDLTNRSVMVSIGGYLHVEDACVTVVNQNPGVIRLRFSNIDMANRYFEMRDALDVRSLGLTTSDIRKNAVVVEELQSDQTLMRLMQMPQSFIVVVDTPSLYTETSPLYAPEILGLYDVPEEPLYPLRAPSGRQIEYWRHYSEGAGWRINTGSNITPKRLYTTTPWLIKRVINDDTIPAERVLTPAKLVAIGTMIRNG